MSETSARALLFPGQGSQQPRMGAAVEAATPDLFRLACDLTGADPFARVGDGTRFAQPAIYCADVAAWVKAGRPEAAVVVGHSLGELAALVAAGALGASEGLRVAALRGRLMQRAAEAAGEGGMLALLGDGAVARAIAELHSLTVANDNAPEQLVVSGRIGAIEAARREARQAGLRAVRLPVAGAFHSPDMEPAARALDRALAGVRFSAPRIPVLSCASAAELTDPRRELAQALVRPVRWRETMLELRRRGVTEFVELGPGKVLTGLVERNPAPAAQAQEATSA